MNPMMKETFRKIGAQQGKKHTRVWHTGEHLKEFLGKYPQYAELVGVDLDNPQMTLTHFEKAIADAARKNGGGLGGEDADAVLRNFYGLPAAGEDVPAGNVSAAGDTFPSGDSTAAVNVSGNASASGNSTPVAVKLDLTSFL